MVCLDVPKVANLDFFSVPEHQSYNLSYSTHTYIFPGYAQNFGIGQLFDTIDTLITALLVYFYNPLSPLFSLSLLLKIFLRFVVR